MPVLESNLHWSLCCPSLRAMVEVEVKEINLVGPITQNNWFSKNQSFHFHDRRLQECCGQQFLLQLKAKGTHVTAYTTEEFGR